MTIDFLSLIFMWLLPLIASNVTSSAPNHNFTAAMTPEVGRMVVPPQVTTLEASTSNTHSKVLARITTQPVTQKMTKHSTRSSQETARTTISTTFSPNTQTTTTVLTNPRSPQLNGSTTVHSMTTRQSRNTTSTSQVTSQAGIPTTTATPTSKDTITHLPTGQTPSTHKTFKTSTAPVVDKSTAAPKTSKTTTKTPSVLDTKDKDGQQKNNESQSGTTQSKAVAGIIGSTLILMFIGFFVIYIRKRKLHTQQITTTDWAGPSPFLQDVPDNGQVTLRSSNRISLSSFLPQRLSKRLSLLQETDEELTEITPGTTFGDKHQGTTFGRETDVTEVEETNGTAVVVPEIKSKGNAPDSEETSMSSSQTNVSVSTNNNSEVANLNQGQPDNLPASPGAAENGTTE